jgi:23S rRNA (uracil1939-C5)-methyltransferase
MPSSLTRPTSSLAADAVVLVAEVVAGGEGFAKQADGRALFVPGAVPGDTIRVSELEVHAGYGRATRWELVTPSAERRTPPCPIAGRCGGCDWMAFTPELQVSSKLHVLKEALRRTAQLPALPIAITTVSSPADLGYRSRIRVHLDPEQGPGFHSNATHQLVPVDVCAVASPAVNQVLTRLRAAWVPRALPWSALNAVEIRALGAKPELYFFPRDEKSPNAKGLLKALLQAFPAATYNIAIAGAGGAAAELRQPVRLGPSLELTIAPGAFTQVNWPVNEAIVRELTMRAEAEHCTTFADLYSGLGNLSIPLLSLGMQGVGVENNALAVTLAHETTQQRGLKGEFLASDVARTAQGWAVQGRTFELVVVDPPRSGVGKAAPDIAALASKFLFICACDPVTFARDLKQYLSAGFTLESLTLYDMFPQTHHFEVTAWLSRR